jgi:multidrug efflux pump subunit AcrA (membrane-fusion protein)
MTNSRKKAYVGSISIIVVGLIVLLVVLAGRPHASTGASEAGRTFADSQEPIDDDPIPTVKTTHPQRNVPLMIPVQEPAYVEGYYEASLRSRVAGPVKFVAKDVGDPVLKNEVLIEIDAPDLLQEVAQKETVIEQRKAEVRYAEAMIKVADDAVEVAFDAIFRKKALVRQASSTMKYRKSEWERFKVLERKKAVNPDYVDERERDYESAVAAWDSARADVKQAEAEWEGMKAKSEAARADVKLRQTLVDVARQDKNRAEVQADFAKIRAPWDGMIVERKIDPGAFVQNATTGSGEPVMSVARVDMVSVYMKLHDSYTDLVTTDTEAVIQMNKRPGELFFGKVSRFPQALDKERNMRVEVDLYNGTEEGYQKLVARGLAMWLPTLGIARPLPALTILSQGRALWCQEMKGNVESFPVFPSFVDKSLRARPRPLMPGMYGSMRLLLRSPETGYLIPSTAITSRGGKRCVLEVGDGTVHHVPVRVQWEHGPWARVTVISHDANPKHGEQDLYRELNGRETIIEDAQQKEYSEGQAVKTSP